jgi:hypothetical protein
MSRKNRKLPSLVFIGVELGLLLLSSAAHAQFYAGGMGGVASLSGDANSVINPPSGAFASYNPQNGPLLDGFVGRHLTDYFTLQADYYWNRNALTLSGANFAGGIFAQYQEMQQSSQQSAFASVLVYFRKRESRIRPYLSIGTGFVHMSSPQEGNATVEHAPLLPSQSFSANMIALRVPVGMDVRLHERWFFRYSFAETISHNPISHELSPPGPHVLKNFQNLFGVLYQF